MARAAKQQKSKKSVFLRLCIFAFVAYAAVMLVDMQVTLANQKEQAKELEQKVEAQRIENKDVERQLAAGMDDESVERIARDQLDYYYPDERVYIDISGS